MSQVTEQSYSNQVCPYCRSKKIRPVGVVRMESNQHVIELSQVFRSGFLCDNCDRHHISDSAKFIIDRAEMRRDVAKLTAFLLGE